MCTLHVHGVHTLVLHVHVHTYSKASALGESCQCATNPCVSADTTQASPIETAAPAVLSRPASEDVFLRHSSPLRPAAPAAQPPGA
eukprot:gene15417-biopygen12724